MVTGSVMLGCPRVKIFRSVPHVSAARTAGSTSPGPGRGTGRSGSKNGRRPSGRKLSTLPFADESRQIGQPAAGVRAAPSPPRPRRLVVEDARRERSTPQTTGKVALPAAASLPDVFPSVAASDSTSSRSSLIWNARPILFPYRSSRDIRVFPEREHAAHGERRTHQPARLVFVNRLDQVLCRLGHVFGLEVGHLAPIMPAVPIDSTTVWSTRTFAPSKRSPSGYSARTPRWCVRSASPARMAVASPKAMWQVALPGAGRRCRGPAGRRE